MNILFYIFLFIFGTMFGSFASVIIYRLKSGEGGMWTGRSHCKTCERNLTALELIPILSWLGQGGKCKGCKQKIDIIYPLLEFIMGALFFAVGYFMISPELILAGNLLEMSRLDFYLGIIFFTVIYVFYDILYLEIPESILLLLNLLILGFLGFEVFSAGVLDSRVVYFDWMNYTNGGAYIWEQFLLAGITIGGLYLIMRAGLKEVYDIAIIIGLWLLLIGAHFHFQSGYPNYIFQSPLINGLFGAMTLFSFFFLQIIISKGTWMGGGDLRIAIAMGLLVGLYFTFPAGMITYLIGSIIGIGIIIYSKLKKGLKADFTHQIPFGPFLACGYLAILFFHSHIYEFIEIYF